MMEKLDVKPLHVNSLIIVQLNVSQLQQCANEQKNNMELTFQRIFFKSYAIIFEFCVFIKVTNKIFFEIWFLEFILKI